MTVGRKTGQFPADRTRQCSHNLLMRQLRPERQSRPPRPAADGSGERGTGSAWPFRRRTTRPGASSNCRHRGALTSSGTAGNHHGCGLVCGQAFGSDRGSGMGRELVRQRARQRGLQRRGHRCGRFRGSLALKCPWPARTSTPRPGCDRLTTTKVGGKTVLAETFQTGIGFLNFPVYTFSADQPYSWSSYAANSACQRAWPSVLTNGSPGYTGVSASGIGEIGIPGQRRSCETEETNESRSR